MSWVPAKWNKNCHLVSAYSESKWVSQRTGAEISAPSLVSSEDHVNQLLLLQDWRWLNGRDGFRHSTQQGLLRSVSAEVCTYALQSHRKIWWVFSPELPPSIGSQGFSPPASYLWEVEVDDSAFIVYPGSLSRSLWCHLGRVTQRSLTLSEKGSWTVWCLMCVLYRKASTFSFPNVYLK